MIAMTVGDVAALTGGHLDGVAPDVQVYGPVVVDSRLCTAGSLFACLPGEQVDGHEFVADAYRRGAVAALSVRAVDGPSIVVDDPVRSLGFLAGGVLRRTSQCTVVGVTGSSGKTSTKDLLAGVLAFAGPTVAPRASLNNEIGLPLTVLGVEESTRYLVLEYSARGVGHIEYLCRIARPAIGVVLNVGTAHLGEFGSREVVAAAKGELVEALPPDGVAVLNVDDPLVSGMRSRTAARVIGFGTSADADVRLDAVQLDPQARPSFRLVTPRGSISVQLQLVGAHHAMNAAATAAVALEIGLGPDEVGEALDSLTAVSAHRMQVGSRADGLLVVDDAYNANPESVRAALDALSTLSKDRAGSSWAVLGEMRELGADGEALHTDVGRHAAELGIDHLVVVGPGADPVAAGAESVASWRGEAIVVAEPEAAVELLRNRLGSDDVVLVKASNALQYWRIAEALLEPIAAERGSGATA
ncbi:MAG TPA: UDP-N-acetylmuramoyl-tripeptide--D-alanyl-D-alanine ligase [Mycobacteriales bacterium]|nr:UDP-N-acetylmuramoyl-tripeptide--D-alanyl-D-alanine ligase [Mycobacteriales bacterium]